MKKIVALGGGTGLPIVLRSLAGDAAAGRVAVAAIVNVVDDGGSSGKIRRLLSTLPPGDARNCLVATARAAPDLIDVFNYRFSTSGELDHHSLGNLIIAALSMKAADFSEAVSRASTLLDCWAKVIPATNELITLLARTVKKETIHGQAIIATTFDPIEMVSIDPAEPAPSQDAIAALAEADAVLVGPGSLYSSIIPVLLVPGIGEALKESSARKVFICNAMTHRAENLGYDAREHYEAVSRHAGGSFADVVIAQDPGAFTPGQLAASVELGAVPVEIEGTSPGEEWLVADVADELRPVHHSPHKLRSCLEEIGVL